MVSRSNGRTSNTAIAIIPKANTASSAISISANQPRQTSRRSSAGLVVGVTSWVDRTTNARAGLPVSANAPPIECYSTLIAEHYFIYTAIAMPDQNLRVVIYFILKK